MAPRRRDGGLFAAPWRLMAAPGRHFTEVSGVMPLPGRLTRSPRRGSLGIRRRASVVLGHERALGRGMKGVVGKMGGDAGATGLPGDVRFSK